ncbi:MocR-like pyridoxine biosynthesis transcription factor PdxR [Helcobacillus massiliensis]|uniref:MocR-like pyridoxine biosynthesis transcription factor PdxR n=3 Tax=Helcobacillus TaxID=1161125 RepID=UPI002553AC35|nr:PLP-dependent aminotransferase family protein [Helcobacillus massiliensis]MDK7742447.1 PLP-dependent aminotransferase family protein [Helcobacillus massiliensis]WOO92466.1 PLP-dependent aminotransferase family protein [Helcobacillus massiliensis]
MAERSTADLALTLTRAGRTPLPVQVADGIRALIMSGALAPGDALPSTRFLAQRLSVSRGTIVAAFDQLISEGALLASQGRPTTVHPSLPAHLLQQVSAAAPDPTAASTRRPASPGASTAAAPGRPDPVPAPAPASAPAVDLRPGLPRTTRIGGAAWRSAWRRAAAAPEAETGGLTGLPDLRAGIAEHLRLMRGLPTDPAALLVTAGSRDGLELILHALAATRGTLSIGVETPGYPGLRRVPQVLGHRIVPLGVDGNGLRVDALPTGAAAPDAVIVTPSHQYPLGGSLSLDRRLALLEWARNEDALIIEDDFNSELRYTGAPLPPLSAIDPHGRTVLLGTFSRLLSPDLAVGFVRPTGAALLAELRDVREVLGMRVSATTQHAVAHLLADGTVRRHTRTERLRLGRRREALLAAMLDVPGVRVLPMHGGSDAVIRFDTAGSHRGRAGADPEARAVAACADAGITVGRLSAAWGAESQAAPVDPSPAAAVGGVGGAGIVLGLARPADGAFSAMLPRLASALATVHHTR